MKKNTLTIVVDLMTENGPMPAIAALGRVIENYPKVEFIAVGNWRALSTLYTHVRSTKLTGKQANSVIPMSEHEKLAILRMRESSIANAIEIVHAGDADACVSAGNTTALVTWACTDKDRLAGCRIPALAVRLPILGGKAYHKQHFLLVDAGSNTNPTPEHLLSYAKMGVALEQNPSTPVYLLNIGEESHKGTQLHVDTYKLLKADQSLHFKGNIEGNQLFTLPGIVLADAQSGNTVLKLASGLMKAVSLEVKSSLQHHVVHGFFAKTTGIAKSAFGSLLAKTDPKNPYGGLVLGVKHIVVKAHGGSSSEAIEGAITFAIELAERKSLIHDIQASLLS